MWQSRGAGAQGHQGIDDRAVMAKEGRSPPVPRTRLGIILASHRVVAHRRDTEESHVTGSDSGYSGVAIPSFPNTKVSLSTLPSGRAERGRDLTTYATPYIGFLTVNGMGRTE